MNKEILDQIPADEQPVASTLFSAAEVMKHSPSFQMQLETQLMEAYKKKTVPTQGWFIRFSAPVSWAVLLLGGIFLLSWAIRSLVPSQHAVGAAATPALTFAESVHQGKMCTGALTVAHNFSVSISNQDKTGFTLLDEKNTIGELRSFAWSPDGKQLAIVGNTTGSGNIYLTDSSGDSLQPVLSNSPLGYLMDVAWSRDGKQLLTWSVQNNTAVYVMNVDGSGLVEKELGMQFFMAPLFTPDGESAIFYGADPSSSGLFEVTLDGSQIRTISALVEDESSFAWSPDGSRLAYIEMDRELGEARFVVEEIATGNTSVIAKLPSFKGSGSLLPEPANLNWSPDGKKLTFEFGGSSTDRAIYMAYTDGSGLVKLADSAYAPAMSADGNCLAYISNKQVFLMDLTGVSPISPAPSPLLLADLPAGRAIAGFRLDKLQWGSGTNP